MKESGRAVWHLAPGVTTLVTLCAACGPSAPVAWTFETFKQRPWHGYCVMTRPAVHDDVVYVGGGYHWRGENSLFALTASGEEIWRSRVGVRFDADEPWVGDEHVFIASKTGIHAFARADGRSIWHYEIPGERGTGIGVVVNDIVVFETTTDLIGVSSQTGDERWTVRTRRSAPRSPIVSLNGTLYLVVGGRLVALNPRTGHISNVLGNVTMGPRLHATRAHVISMSMQGPSGQPETAVVAPFGPTAWYDGLPIWANADTVVLAGNGATRAVEPGTGRVLWSTDQLPSASAGGAQFAGRWMFQRNPRDARQVVAFDIESGSQLWKFATGDFVMGPERSGDLVLFGSDDCTVYAVHTR